MEKATRAAARSVNESSGAPRGRALAHGGIEGLYPGREKTAKETKRRHNGGQADNAWWLRTRPDSGVSPKRTWRRLDVDCHSWWASGRWFAKSTQGLLRIQDAVVGRWWAVVVCGGCALVGIIVRAWWPWCPWWAWCECEGCTRAICSRMGHREILPTQPCIRRLGQCPKTAFSDVGCARTAGNGL